MLERSSGNVIVLDDASINDFLGGQFKNGLKEIEVEAQVSIDALEEIILRNGLKAVITNATSNLFFLFFLFIVK